jgi:hypothetical protein
VVAEQGSAFFGAQSVRLTRRRDLHRPAAVGVDRGTRCRPPWAPRPRRLRAGPSCSSGMGPRCSPRRNWARCCAKDAIR